jgi:hypothetical protein
VRSAPEGDRCALRAGRPSWQITIDEPEDLHLVLFVRDCFGLPGDSPGRLSPPVPDLSGQLDESARSAAAAAWPAWWQAVLGARAERGPQPPRGDREDAVRRARLFHAAADGPEFASLAGDPALSLAARTAFGPFQQWWSPPLPGEPGTRPGSPRGLGLPGAHGELIDLHHGSSAVHDVIGRIEQELGRPARPFELRVEVLAARSGVVWQDQRGAVISARLAGDEAGYRDWLDRAIRPLA